MGRDDIMRLMLLEGEGFGEECLIYFGEKSKVRRRD